MKRESLREVALFSILAAIAGVASCSTQSQAPGTTSDGQCTPGQQLACACPAGGNGSQTCNADGKGFGPCNGCAQGQDGSLSSDADTTDSATTDASSNLDSGSDTGADAGDLACNQAATLAACTTCCSNNHPGGQATFCSTVPSDCCNTYCSGGTCSPSDCASFGSSACAGGASVACNNCVLPKIAPQGLCTQSVPAGCSGDAQCLAYANCFKTECAGK